MLPRYWQYGEDDIREWFHAANTDNGGTVSMNEWFMWTLARQTLNGADALRNLFRRTARIDKTLGLDEFQALANDMGFGAAATPRVCPACMSCSMSIVCGIVVSCHVWAGRGRVR